MNKFTLLFISACFIQNLSASIKLPALVSSNMVLQRDKPIKIWGFGKAGEKLSVDFAGKHLQTITAQNGKWDLTFPALKAGGPYIMILKGENTIRLNDILIGDIWICSGQSNMEFNLQDVLNASEELKNANYPRIRLFNVEKKISLNPETDTRGNWNVCSPEHAKYFPAIGYFFGKKIGQDLDIPIGLINASWGGTVIESWISAEGLKTEPTFGQKASKVATFDTVAYNKIQRELNQKWIDDFNLQDEGFKNGTYLWANTDTKYLNTIKLPDGWEFTGINDLWELDGVVWFMKEIELNEAQCMGDAILNLGVILNADQAFVNGHQIGKTSDSWGKIRSYPISKSLLKPGKNIITLRIENYGGDGGFMSKAPLFYLKTSADSLSLAGDWKYKIGHKLISYNRPEKEISPNTLPTLMYNNMINPLIYLNIKGVLWYQGESNWNRAYQYRELFPRMIADWRKKFNQGNFPFLYVQLANFHKKQEIPGDSYWAEVREAQAMAQAIPNTGMATAIDLGDPANIHPKNKQGVAQRLVMLAEKQVYHLPVGTVQSPSFEDYQLQGNAVLIRFKNIADGLKTINNESAGNFQIAGNDKVFYWAKAEIINKNTIKVFSNQVTNPIAVRYAWEDNPEAANVISSIGLPLLPFRTDNWKGLTADAK